MKQTKQTKATKSGTKRAKVETDDVDSKSTPGVTASDPNDDELAEINGIKPQVFLQHEEEREVGSTTRYIDSSWSHILV